MIGYESTPVRQIVAIVVSVQSKMAQKFYFEKVRNLSSPIDFSTSERMPGVLEYGVFLK